MPGPTTSSSGTVASSKALQTRRSGSRSRNGGNRLGPSSESFLDKRFSLRDVARQSAIALQVGKQALALVNAEKKYLYAAGNDAPGTTPVITPVSLMATGDTASSRDGLSVRFKGVDIRGSVAINAANTTYDFVRVIFLRQSISSGAAPPALEILTQLVPKSAYAYKFRKNYKFLWDQTFAVNPVQKNQTFSAYIPLDNVSTWDDVSSSITDTESNVYYMYVIGATASDNSMIDWTTQMYFYDN